jgi:hypothetical protein
MGKRIIRNRHLTDAEAERATAIRAEFAPLIRNGRRPTKSEVQALCEPGGPMNIEEYLAWRRGQTDAPLTKQLRQAVRSCGKPTLTIAQAAGIPQPVLQRFLSGERGIMLDTAGKLAAYLGLALLPESATKH